MEALYKMKKPKTGQADRSMRARMKDTASKSSRANLLDSKRRIPLSEVQQPSTNKMPDEADMVKEEKPKKSRVERLQEWKRQRDEARAKQCEQKKNNPPFRPCGNKKARPTSTVTTHHPPTSKSIPTAKKSVNSSISSSKATPDTTTICNNIKKTIKVTGSGPAPRSSARLAAKHQAVASIVRNTSKTREPMTRATVSSRMNSSGVSNSSKSHIQTAASKKQGTAKPPTTGGGHLVRNAVHDSKSVAAKATAPVSKKMPAKTQTSVREKRATRATTARTASTKNSGVAKRDSISSKNQKTKNTQNKNKPTHKAEVSVEVVEEMEQSTEEESEPPTPTKRSYRPIHPSPLLKSRVAPVRRETVFMPRFVNEPAWIPGAFIDTNTNSSALDPNFDEAFQTNSFSPFHFTATQNVQVSTESLFSPELQQCQFVFKPAKLNYTRNVTASSSEVESSDSGLHQKPGDPPAKKRRRNSRRCSRKLEMVLPLIMDSSGSVSESSNIESTSSSESQVEDITTGCDGAASSSQEIDIGSSDHKVATPPVSKRRRSSKRRSRRSGMKSAITADSLNIESEGVSSNNEGTHSTESQEDESRNGGEDAIDFDYFCGLHAKVTDQLTLLCQDWEERSNKLEEQHNNSDNSGEDINMEDVLGQIRTTVCQAQLLMRKKLKQYMNLVEQAQDLTVEKRANADDLQSFWDMIYFQVEDVHKKFDTIEKLEKNGWKEKAPTPAKKRAKKRKAGTKKTGSDSSEANERLQAAREKREAQRNRLKELKLAAKRAREQETEEPTNSSEDTQTEEEPLPVAPSPKKTRVAHTPDKSSTKRERRRSQRLISRSVFSPVQSSGPVNCISEVPTGCLVAFSPLKL